MAEAAGADIVDLNLGCPMAPVLNAGAGTKLAARPQVAGNCVRAMVAAVKIPVTVKMRAGERTWDNSYIALAVRLVDEGAKAVSLHGRTAAQAYHGFADWATIANLVEALDVPVIGNGDLHTGEEGVRRMRETGCAAVMFARGAMGNPWVFQEFAAAIKGEPRPPEPTEDERLALALWHAQMLVLKRGEHDGVVETRRQILPYLKGLAGSKSRRVQLSQATSLKEIADALLSRSRDRQAWV
jgi:nifR3 family TIM-barrel protein